MAWGGFDLDKRTWQPSPGRNFYHRFHSDGSYHSITVWSPKSKPAAKEYSWAFNGARGAYKPDHTAHRTLTTAKAAADRDQAKRTANIHPLYREARARLLKQWQNSYRLKREYTTTAYIREGLAELGIDLNGKPL